MSFSRRINSLVSRWRQSRYDLTEIDRTNKLIIFIVPFVEEVNGGVMSIFSLCENSRRINPEAAVFLCTEPNKYTYAVNRKFLNREKVCNLKQILDRAGKVEELIIHVPEYLAAKFYRRLTPGQRQLLQKLPSVQINILNQNIELMPPRQAFDDLFRLTSNITQTTAHNRYATQEVCNRFGIPLHHFSVSIDVSKYKKYPFNTKEKLVVLSPDDNPHRQEILNIISRELPDYRVQTVQGITFEQFMDLIARAFVVISFGEGYDGYFVQPWYVDTMGLAVYNEKFFPGPEWRSFANVYASFSELSRRLAVDIRRWEQDKNLYYQTIERSRNLNNTIYSYDTFLDNLRRFYNRQYDFYPQG